MHKVKHEKNLILLAFITFIIVGSLCLLFGAVSMMNTPRGTNPVPPTSYPTSFGQIPPGNIIIIGGDKNKIYKFAVITDEDTLELRNAMGEKFIIGLDHRKWKDVKFAPNSVLLSVLGETKDKVYDLFIYNLITQSWHRATQFQNASSGVESYVWKDGENILFVQGKDNDRWLHKFNYPSGSEILKLNKVAGDVIKISSGSKYLLSKNDAIFSILDIDGKVITTLDTIEDENTEILDIDSISFTKDPEKLIFETNNGKIYKGELGNKKVALIEEVKDFKAVCSLNENEFIGYDYDLPGNRIRVSNLNIKDEKLNVIAESVIKQIKNIDRDESHCFENANIILNIELEEEKWYQIDKGELEEMFGLRGAREISINNL